ncbi:MAG TPA: hypothetical protein VF609_12420, partial [Flavisolibacter sp.]
VLAFISDKTNSIQNGYIVPLVCFIVVFYFGLKGYKPKSGFEDTLTKSGVKGKVVSGQVV